MDTTFRIRKTGQVLTTPNLEKKLKRMKLTLDDIEIVIEDPIKKVLPDEYKCFKNHFRLLYGTKEPYTERFVSEKDWEDRFLTEPLGKKYPLYKVQPYEEWSKEVTEMEYSKQKELKDKFNNIISELEYTIKNSQYEEFDSKDWYKDSLEKITNILNKKYYGI